MSAGELIVSIIGDMSKLSGVFQQVQSDIGGFGSKMSSIGSSLSSAGRGMSEGVTAPIVAVGAGIGVTMAKASEFDTGMRRVATMLPGLTEQGFTKISNQALTLSKDFGSSTSDMTNAMYQALSSGVPKDNIFSFMQEAEELAIGGATDVVTATDVLTNAVNSYGEANLSTAQASDILFQGTKFGKSTVEELAKTLSNVVPVAASMGVGFDDVNASLATMTIQGTPTAQATTQLRAIMDELSDKTSDASVAFEALSGKTFEEFIKSGGSVGEAMMILQGGVGQTVVDMEKLNKVVKKMEDPNSKLAQQFNQIAGESIQQMIAEGKDVVPVLDKMGITVGTTAGSVKDYFSRIEAGTGALQLVTDKGKLYEQSMQGMATSTGATAEAYKTMSEGSGAALDRLKSHFETLIIKIGQNFLPILSDTLIPIFEGLAVAIDKVTPIIKIIADAFNSLPMSVKLAALGFIAFVAALGPVLIIAGAVASGIGAIAGLFGTGGALAGAITFVSGTLLPALSAAFGVIVYTVIPILVEALGLLLTPFGLLAAGIAIFAIAWSRNWFDIQGKAQTVWNWIKTSLSGLSNDFKTAYANIIAQGDTLKQQFSNAWNSVIQLFSSIKTGIIAAANGLYSGLQGVYNSIVSGVGGFVNSWKAQWTNFTTSISSVSSAVSGYLSALYSKMVGVFNQIKSAASSFNSGLSSVWNTIKSSTTSFSSGLQSILSSLYSKAQSVFNQIRSAASSFHSGLSSVWNTIKSSTTSFSSGLQSILSSLYSKAQSIFNQIKSAASSFNSTLNSTWNSIKSVTSSFSSSIQSTLSSMYSRLQSIFSQIKSAASGLQSTLSSIWNSIVSAARTAGSNLYSAISGIPGQIRGLASAFSNAGSAILDALYDSITSGFNKAIKKAKSALADLKSYLPNSPAEKGPFRVLPNWDAVFVDPLVSSIRSMGSLSNNVSGALSNIKSPINSSMTSGMQSVSNVSNSSTVVEGSKYSIGPISVRNDSDLEAIISAVKSSIANDRRRAGIF